MPEPLVPAQNEAQSGGLMHAQPRPLGDPHPSLLALGRRSSQPPSARPAHCAPHRGPATRPEGSCPTHNREHLTLGVHATERLD